MIEGIPHLNPERPEESKRPGGERLAGSRALVLTNQHVRVLCVGFAAFETATIAGLWGMQVDFAWPVWHMVLAAMSAAISVVGLAYFLGRLRSGTPISDREPRVLLALLINFLWPSIPTVFVAAFVPHPDPFLFEEPFSQVVGVVLATICVAVFHGIPALVLFRALRARVGRDDSYWTQDTYGTSGRSAVLLGLSMMVGGWTATMGVVLYGIVQVVFIQLGFDWLSAREIVFVLGAMNFVYVFGMAAGFVMALFTATIPSDTQMDKTVPRLFGTTFVIGSLASIFHPLVGALAAAFTAVAISFSVRKRYPLIELGNCQRCRYNLHGLGSPVCPECGYSHEPHELPSGFLAEQ